MDRKEYLARLIDAIREVHHLEVSHRGTVPVTEKHRDQIVWEGEVEVFDVGGHAGGQTVYAWGHENDGDPQKLEVTAVLEKGKIDSAQKAVQAAIRQETRQMTAN